MDKIVNKNVSDVVWPWRDAAAVLDAQKVPLARVLVQFCLVSAVASLLFFGWSHRIAGGGLYGIALVLLVSGLFVPPVFFILEKTVLRLTKALATGLSWLLLTLLYLLLFTPGRLCFRLAGKNAMARGFQRDVPSYWIEHDKKEKHYSNQF